MRHDAIAVIDFGGQYAHLIATKVRRARVLAEIRQPEDPIEAFRSYKGIIISGSPALSSHGEDSAYNKWIYELGIPILGFCFGHQEIAKHYGGTVVHGGREWGNANFRIIKKGHPLFSGLGEIEQVFMSHFDSVASVGQGFEEYGTSFLSDEREAHRFAAIGSDTLRRYGFQFHPEVDDTVDGQTMIANFVLGICACRPTWTMERFLDDQIEAVRRQVGSESVFLLASGGVDSTVAARVLGMALGPGHLHLLHIDNGLMRKGESADVMAMFRQMGLDRNLHFVDASADFLGALGDEVDPEKKRRIIGDTFIAVFQREAARLGIERHLLGQGTIYPDTIETGGTKRADTIKTHHNRVPIIDRMVREGRVVEPLSELYKVEVRELGERLGIPREIVWRHPFPGPGLGVRLLCSDGAHDPAEVGKITPAAADVARPFGLGARALPVRSVGVKADLRSYEHPVMLFGDAPYEKVVEAAGEIFKKVPGVNRCLLNLSPAPPAATRPVRATMTRGRLEALREADHLVMDGLRRHGVYDGIWQCPTVFVPLEIDGKGRELCVIRPVYSERAMTAKPAPLPPALVAEFRESVLRLPGVSGLALDVTSKPPGTIEWE
ncbi:MAG: glutamine-hydrolyzing GMP synthase [Deltaproteobacteria bacterium]|nr:glutamine-hydrolyzing GMP synthase [Deltaproteobacteria bacterium]